MTRTAARALVETLERQGVDRVFCVPGESYLDVLDALRDSSIETVVARHEGAAAMILDSLITIWRIGRKVRWSKGLREKIGYRGNSLGG